MPTPGISRVAPIGTVGRIGWYEAGLDRDGQPLSLYGFSFVKADALLAEGS